MFVVMLLRPAGYHRKTFRHTFQLIRNGDSGDNMSYRRTVFSAVLVSLAKDEFVDPPKKRRQRPGRGGVERRLFGGLEDLVWWEINGNPLPF